MLCLLCVLLSTHLLYAQTGKPAVKYLSAADVVEMAKTSGKPYLWLSLYIPKCANAHQLFSDRVAYYNKQKDKLDIVMVTIMNSADNREIFAQYSETFQFQSPFYVLDTTYQQQGLRETPAAFMKDLNQKLGAAHATFQNIIIDKNGKLIYREDDNLDTKKADKLLK